MSDPSPAAAPGPGRTVYLLSCVSRKRGSPSRARDLYTSDWFVKARGFVEASGCRWYVLSAEYGLVAPDAVIAPYERTLNRMAAADRRAWADKVLRNLVPQVALTDRVVIFAGERYREHLVPAIASRCAAVDVPLQGLGIGKQLQWFVQRARERL